MIQTIELFPGITLRCIRQSKFKQGCLSIQIVRPMASGEASVNALIPAILLRGTQDHPDLRSITLKLDDLYGASVGTLVRRIGDYQTTGLYCNFMEDRFAMEGDRILQPMTDFLQELMFHPVMEDGGFSQAFTESEKRNLILTIESERNDKRLYAASQLLRLMCKGDSFGIPRLGEIHQAQRICAKSAYAHYQKILWESPMVLFYVGSAPAEEVSALLKPIFAQIKRDYQPLAPQGEFRGGAGAHRQEQMEVSQAKLGMGFVTPITNRKPEFAAMQLLNTIFGAGMTSKLFLQLREELSLCYSIHSGYYGAKGILTVNAGIDPENETLAREKILQQLQLCCEGNISQEELVSAKEAILSGIRSVHDSPGAMEGYYSTQLLSGGCFDLNQYRQAIENATLEQVVSAAKTLSYHSSFVLKGVAQ